MGRSYTINFGNVSISAVQDAIAATATASMAFEAVGFGLAPSGARTISRWMKIRELY